MKDDRIDPAIQNFLKSLGFPAVRIHDPLGHFDFRRPGRRILVIGPMGSGKTEFSSRVWRDSCVALNKAPGVARLTGENGADRRRVFFIRSSLDRERFPDYPPDALPYRGGYVRCGERIADMGDSFALESLLKANPDTGTWIVDEAAFYEERLVYVVQRESQERGLIFIFPSLILNFRREIFNSTARMLLETATDIFPLTAYCEHPECLEDSFYTYRYYRVNGEECPALYFDPLIIVGGDRQKEDPREPNYCTRCDSHHYLPGKEYAYLTLKPLGEEAARGDLNPLETELGLIRDRRQESELYRHFNQRYLLTSRPEPAMMNALKVPCLAEKALVFLHAEQNLLSRDHLEQLVQRLGLDREYLNRRLADNHRGAL